MTGIKKSSERIIMTLCDRQSGSQQQIFIDVIDNSLSRRWIDALIDAVKNNLHLEKNYCFLGFPGSPRDGEYLCAMLNDTIAAINHASIDYTINDYFVFNDLLSFVYDQDQLSNIVIHQQRLNQLHRYFEDLQGTSGSMSLHYQRANKETRWHIRQLNLLCHELETWLLSYKKLFHAPEWVRPSQLMCWLCAPRFALQPEDLDLFGIDSMYRELGGVYVGVNKAIGKHHWEVFKDEGRDSRIDELTTTSLRSQTEAAADFDIEWAQDTRGHPWMAKELADFKTWLSTNGFDPTDPYLTIGHPKVAQVDLLTTFGTTDVDKIWQQLYKHLDVSSISVAGITAIYDYHWSDHNYMHQQIFQLGGH